MKCCKDPCGVFLVIITHIILIIQTTLIYYSTDDYEEEQNDVREYFDARYNKKRKKK